VARGYDAPADDFGLPWFAALHGDSRQAFLKNLSRVRRDVVEALADGNAQVLPILICSGLGIKSFRAATCPSVWRKIHHATEQTNFLRALVWLRFHEHASWAEVVRLPEVHLRSCRNAIDWPTAKFAAHLAGPGTFSQIAMVYRDMIKMNIVPSAGWSVARLKREHAEASVGARIDAADPVVWGTPLTVLSDGFVFTRLISDRQIITEGSERRHCVGSYLKAAQMGECGVMACTGRERATLLSHANGDYELSGYANAPVSADCIRAAKKARQSLVDILSVNETTSYDLLKNSS
jgi:hypothetical protein